MPAPDYVLRFVGRFVVAVDGAPERPRSVSVLAPRMIFNPDLRAHDHHLLITGPRFYTQTLGTTAPEYSLFHPTTAADALAENYVWPARGCDAAIEGVGGAGIELVDFHLMPNLERLASARFDRRVLSEPLTPDGPVAGRFTFHAGSFTVSEFDADKRVSFEALEKGEPEDPATERLPDVLDVALSSRDTTSPLSIVWQRVGARSRGSIAFARPRGDTPVVITITNLCAHRGARDDTEFAAYYDLLLDPPRPRLRRIPYTSTVRLQGAKADCTGIAAVTLAAAPAP